MRTFSNGIGRSDVPGAITAARSATINSSSPPSGARAEDDEIHGNRGGVHGSPVHGLLWFLTMCLVGQLVDVQLKDGSVHNANVDNEDFSVVLKTAKQAGIIAKDAAGTVRMNDTRQDKAERGITIMMTEESLKHLINLIDSPGHVDFCFDVTSALRITDGALVVIEGVCVQTVTFLRQAPGRPVLCNKMDRCFVELKVEGEEAYHVIENANVIMAAYQDSHLADVRVYPENGTVAFTAGLYGYAFTLRSFAKMYAFNFGIDEKTMMERLWGEDVFDPATRKWTSRNTGSPTCVRGFVQFIYNPEKEKHLMKKVMQDSVPCGNTIAMVGLDQFITKTLTLTDVRETEAFPIRAMKFTVLPVGRVALKRLAKSDPVVLSIAESGEHIIAGAGELHLEICLRDESVETVLERSRQVMSKSPNKHNRLYFEARPPEEGLPEAIDEGKVSMRVRSRILSEKFGWDIVKKIWAFGPESTGPNMVVDVESVCSAFQWASKIAEINMRGICFEVDVEVVLHTYALHRGGARIIATAIYGAQLPCDSRLLKQPVYLVGIQAPGRYLQCAEPEAWTSDRGGAEAGVEIGYVGSGVPAVGIPGEHHEEEGMKLEIPSISELEDKL